MISLECTPLVWQLYHVDYVSYSQAMIKWEPKLKAKFKSSGQCQCYKGHSQEIKLSGTAYFEIRVIDLELVMCRFCKISL